MKIKQILVIIFVIAFVFIGIQIYKIFNSSKIIEVMTNDVNIKKIENGLSSATFAGNDYFDDFLNNGEANSDLEVVNFLNKNILSKDNSIDMNIEGTGCSTFQIKNKNDEYLFGRNFDWQHSEALVVISKPDGAYKSISTVNMDFITGINQSLSKLPDKVKTLISLYAPLDGMNEKGLVVSVNMIEDSSVINQNTNKPDITTTTAIRLLLNKAATTDEAISLLENYDLHSSMGWMVHFMIADSSGKSVAIEYVDNQMKVIETNILTNFYIDKGSKYGIGSSQSKARYEVLENTLDKQKTMEMDDVRDALDSVSKDNFNEFESTEWSIVYNQKTLDVNYYHRENYKNKYTFKL